MPWLSVINAVRAPIRPREGTRNSSRVEFSNGSIWVISPRRRPKYSMIFVLSLFSHLPETTWGLWLERLYQALEVDGVLIFTTHGAKCARILGVPIPEAGFQFVPSSESTALSKEEYGTAFTTAEYVRRVIGSRFSGATVHEFPEKFWGNQDAYAVVKTA